jgi:hypothetical protein
MAQYAQVNISSILGCNCECFKNETIQPSTKSPVDIHAFIAREKKRSEAFCDQVHKHTIFDFNDTFRPCHGVSSTNGMVLRSSQFRHQNTLKRLKQMLKGKTNNVFVNIRGGKEVPVDKFVKTMNMIVETDVLALETFADANSTVSISKLKESEKRHQETLNLMEEFVKPKLNDFEKIEINVDCDL